MKSMLKKILLLVAVGAVAFACKDVKPDPKPKPKPEPEPSVFKIAINVADGEQYTSQIDSVEAYYSTKEFNTVVLRRMPYNNGKFELELLDTIQNKDFQTIVEYYALKSVIQDVSVSDATTLIAPIEIRCLKDGKITGYYITPRFTVEGADHSSGKYYYCDKNCELSMDKKIDPIYYVMKLKLVKGYNFIQSINYYENNEMKIVFSTEQQGDFVWKIWKEEHDDDEF
jgi:hypothetical protein